MRAAARPDPVSTADRLALTDLVHRYAAHVDDGLFDRAAALFAETAELVVPNPPEHLGPTVHYRGQAGVLDALAPLRGLTRTRHEIVGEVHDLGAGTATGRIACVAHHWTVRDGTISDAAWHVRYDDTYALGADGWRFTRRALTVDAIETPTVRRVRA